MYETYIEPMQALAEENGIGFMVNEMGVCSDCKPENALAEEDCIAYMPELTTTLQAHGVPYAYYMMNGDASITRERSEFPARNGETAEKITYEMDGYNCSFYADMVFLIACFPVV